MKKYLSLFFIIFLGSIFHICFFSVNEILKNADNFAYLQMSYHFKDFSLEGFGTGWFGFFYSFFIAIFDILTLNFSSYYSALFLNIILFGVGAFLLFKISRFYLDKNYSLLVIFLYYFSPILLGFNISILSENIYIPTFLGFFYFLLKKIQEKNFNKKNIFIISFFIALLYFTRAEAFIYLGSIVLIFFFSNNFKNIFTKKHFINFFKNSFFLVFFFFLIISPYLFHLHFITGEWLLTNKGSANLRQAELRGTQKMDDEGFEKAVGELTDDKHYLKSGFVGGLDYNPGEKTKGLKNYLLENPLNTISRILKNQIKLYKSNLPEIIAGNTKNLYNSKDSFLYKNYLFLFISIFPILLVLYGIYKIFREKKYDFLLVFFSFYFVASLFFTLFFVLNRYFLIFLPLFLIFLVYGIKSINFGKYLNYLIVFGIISFYLLGNYVYYNGIKGEDEKYEVKKIAGEWIKKELRIGNGFENPSNHLYQGEINKEELIEKNNLIHNIGSLDKIKVMERFPIVTYYSGTKKRFLTPFTDNLEDLFEYAKFNKIDYFVVDSLDFKIYRPKLAFLLDENYKSKLLHKIKIFQVNGEKVILYKFNY